MTHHPHDGARTRRHPRAVRLSLVYLFGLLTASAGCTAPKVGQAQPAKPTAEQLMQSIQAEIGPARCDRDTQCRTMAVGSKACGGPQGWLAWSTLDTQEARLRALAEAHAKTSRAEDERLGRVSNCAIVIDPGARCEAGHCVPKSNDLPLQARPGTVQ